MSLSQKLDSSINLNNIDPDELFTKHSISEIRMVQHRLRAEADAKQEELRLMVGERYRDLLQASTSILSLAKSSKHVLEALEEMRDAVNSINPARAPKRSATGEDKHLQALQSLSAHVKLLLDAPEHLWRLMERKAYLNAAWLFLLARVVHRALSQDDDDRSWHAYGIDVTEQLPLVQRQWDTITPFRSQISHRATLFLREASSTPGEVCATLLTLHLLESRPIPETLLIYLAQRTKTLSNLLAGSPSTSANGTAADAKPNGKAPHRPRKVVVREAKQSAMAALDALSRTVGTARLIFADSASGASSTMKEALHFFQAPSDSPGHLPVELQLSTQILLSSLPSSSQLLLLPQNIRTYKPYVDGAALAAPSMQTLLREKLGSWFGKALQDLRHALADWFTPLECVREVWEVRSALLQWLNGADGLEEPERRELESIIDGASFKQATTVWKAALSRLESSFQEAIAAATTALTENAGEHKLDTQPVEYLLQAPSIPPGLQAGAHSAAVVAAQFSKYRSSLRQQLDGRTPLVDSALTALEAHARHIQEDLAIMHKSLNDASSSLIEQLSDAYRVDAERSCGSVYEVLENTAVGEDPTSRVPMYIGRIAQELASSSHFLEHIGCGDAAMSSFRERLQSLATDVMQKWQTQTVTRIVHSNLQSHQSASNHQRLITENSSLPSRPSPPFTDALLSLSFELQQLGACLNDRRRQQQVSSTLKQFISTLLDWLEGDSSPQHADDLQVLWDISFLQRLARLWEPDSGDVLGRIDANIARRREHFDAKAPPQPDITASTEEYLARTQILFAPLLPSLRTGGGPAKKSDKPSSLLLFGSPSAEQGFEPALHLVKTPPRFGLLLVGGAAVR